MTLSPDSIRKCIQGIWFCLQGYTSQIYPISKRQLSYIPNFLSPSHFSSKSLHSHQYCSGQRPLMERLCAAEQPWKGLLRTSFAGQLHWPRRTFHVFWEAAYAGYLVGAMRRGPRKPKCSLLRQNRHWHLSIPLGCLEMLKPWPLSWARPFPHWGPPWGNRNIALHGNALVGPRLAKNWNPCFKESVLQGIKIVSHDLCFSGKVSHSLLRSGLQITLGLKAFFPSCLYYLLDYSVTGFRLLPLPSLTHRRLVLFLTYTTWVWLYCSFLFLPAKCEPACRHGGVCVRPNKCLCKKGYLGPQCEQVDRNIRRVTRAGILDQIIDMTSYLLDLTSYIV